MNRLLFVILLLVAIEALIALSLSYYWSGRTALLFCLGAIIGAIIGIFVLLYCSDCEYEEVTDGT